MGAYAVLEWDDVWACYGYRPLECHDRPRFILFSSFAVDDNVFTVTRIEPDGGEPLIRL